MDEPDEFGFLGAKRIVTMVMLHFGIMSGFSVIRALDKSNDLLLKRSLAVIYMVFYTAAMCNILSMSVPLILDFCQCHRYKKVCHIIGATASFLFMLHGYGLLMSFIVNHP